jgi:hypothetical protein
LTETVNIDIVDCGGRPLRRALFSADHLSDCAIRSGSLQVNTPSTRSSASGCSVTSRDHFVRLVMAINAA